MAGSNSSSKMVVPRLVEVAAYRIEQRCGDAVVVVHEGPDLGSCAAEFSRLADQLVSLGASGVLQLVERSTGDVLDCRVLPGELELPKPRSVPAPRRVRQEIPAALLDEAIPPGLADPSVAEPAALLGGGSHG